MTNIIFRFRYLIGTSLIIAIIIGIGYSSYQPLSPIQINEINYTTSTTPTPPGTLNDIFDVKPKEELNTPSLASPSFLNKIILGWQAIYYKLFQFT